MTAKALKQQLNCIKLYQTNVIMCGYFGASTAKQFSIVEV